jgi:transposase
MDVPQCRGCRERDAVIGTLLERVVALETEVRELKARLAQHASNSSMPPSANPPGAPAPVLKKPTGRRPGGQPGHRGQTRVRLPPQRLQQVVPFVPPRCARCQAPLPIEAGPDDPEPTWHQVAELPEQVASVTEYQGHARTCPSCGHVTRAPIPAALRATAIGPRLAAALSYLRGCPHVSQRGVEEIVETIFGVPVALGTISHLEQEMSQALACAYEATSVAVQAAPVKHVDETGWKRAGKPCWLWAAATQAMARFVIHGRRSVEGLRALVGQALAGILCSDRWAAYQHWATRRRQVCWAHLKRDFQRCVDRGGPAARIGRDGLSAVAYVFEGWYAFRGGGLSRAGMRKELVPIRRELRGVLERGCGCADRKVARFCRNVLAVESALWTFTRVEGVEPTNNLAERVLRSAVLWRKRAFGCHSEAGCRFVERMLTVVQTLRLQRREVVDYLHRALVAHRTGLPPPQLLSEA